MRQCLCFRERVFYINGKGKRSIREGEQGRVLKRWAGLNI